MILVVAALIVGGSIVWKLMNKNNALIDNPTDKAITFQLDGKEYTLEPKTSQSVKLADGEHKLSIDGEELTFTKEDPTKDTAALLNVFGSTAYAIVNPTRSDYILGYQMYGNWPDSAWPEDIEYKGQVFFQLKADFDVNEALPNTLSLPRGQNYTVKSKIFRIDDYVAEYGEEILEELQAANQEE